MYLNEFLQVKLSVVFEDKYNTLATKEIMDNKENYPLISEMIENEINSAQSKNCKWNYSSDFFDCDDIELCANYDETMELYRAFVNAFSNDIKGKNARVNYASIGLSYLEEPNTHNVLDFNYHYLGTTHIGISIRNTELCEKIFYPNEIDGMRFGLNSIEKYKREYDTKNANALEAITKNIKEINLNDFFCNTFENEELLKKCVQLKNGKTAYPCYTYEIHVGKNVLRFFTTESGFDTLGLIRLPLFDTLTEEQQNHDIVKNIKRAFNHDM